MLDLNFVFISCCSQFTFNGQSMSALLWQKLSKLQSAAADKEGSDTNSQ